MKQHVSNSRSTRSKCGSGRSGTVGASVPNTIVRDGTWNKTYFTLDTNLSEIYHEYPLQYVYSTGQTSNVYNVFEYNAFDLQDKI